MGKRLYSRTLEAGCGKAVVLAFLVLILIALGLAWMLASRGAPAIQLQGQIRGLGKSAPLEFEVRDSHHHLQRVEVEVRQDGQVFVVLDRRLPVPPRWKMWARAGSHEARFTVRLGQKEIPGLREGRATLVITAHDDSWGDFFRGGTAEVALDLPVRFSPPTVEVLTAQHYVNQGGCDMAIFKVSPGAVESGIRVGKYFFPSWPVNDSSPQTRLCVFAYPYDEDPKTPARIVARDEVGNETLANFNYKVIPRKFKKDTIALTDEFMDRVVPPILSQTPELQDQGSLLKNFLLVNGALRRTDAQQLIAFSRQTSPRWLWTQPFVQLGNSRVEAAFADDRAYVYNGQVVDRQTHLGFDLAVVQHTPVVAANDGVVVYAGYFGIYGNTVVIDHGRGLQSLYGHLSSFNVKAGDHVTRGQVIARSGQTGLAGGDHLHFSMLLDGIPVNPVEWWDAHWIRDQIDVKLAPYR